MSEISRLAILAPGLLGGSLAKAKKEHAEVRVWGRSAERLALIEKDGYSVVSTNLEDVISEAELIVMAMPIAYMKDMAERLVAAGLKPQQLVTDVGSVKEKVLKDVQPLLGARGFTFIGSHPMAGSEATGYEAASPTLFQDAACIITPDEFTQEAHRARLAHFWQSVGCEVHELDAGEHDRTVSRVSHLPHILSAVCAHVALPTPEIGKYAGNGLRDTSRVASGDPAMWAGITTGNKDALRSQLEEAMSRLKQYQDALDKEEDLRQLFTEDKKARDDVYQI